MCVCVCVCVCACACVCMCVITVESLRELIIFSLHFSADCEYTYEEMEGEMKSKLMALADNACTYIHGQRYIHNLIEYLCTVYTSIYMHVRRYILEVECVYM